MQKENIREKIKQTISQTKKYSAFIGLQILLLIGNGCESPKTSDKNSNQNNIEVIDTNNVQQLAEKYEQIAKEAMKTQDQTVVIPNLTKALDYYQQLGNRKKEQIISKNIASGYYQQKNYPKYLEYIHKAQQIAEEINYEYGIRFANASLGGYHYEIKNQPEIALNKFYLPGREALKKVSNEEDKKELQVAYSCDIANCYMSMKNYKEAKKYRNQAIETNKEINDVAANVFIHYNMGVAEQNQSNYAEAEQEYLKGITLSEAEGTTYNTKEGYNYLANLYEILGDHKKAYEYRTKQYELAQEINNETSSRTQIELETNIKDKQLIQQKAEIVQKNERENTLEAQKEKGIRVTIAALIAALGAGGLGIIAHKKKKEKEKQNNILTAQKEEISKQKKIIETAHNNIKESIEAGKQVQEQMVLPRPEYIKSLFPESFILFKPRDGVSGDFYRFKETKSGKKLFAAIDCTGHGIPGAFVSVTGRNILDAAVDRMGFEKPSEILAYLDHEIIDIQSDTKGEDVYAKYGMDIALCSRDEKTKTLEYSGAVNPIYIINKDEKGTNTRIINPNRKKIGYRFKGQEEEYINESVEIKDENSIIYLFSDGYQDQFGGKNRKKLKRNEFQKYIEQTTRKETTMEGIQKSLEDKFEKRIGDEDQIDDVLVMGIKV